MEPPGDLEQMYAAALAEQAALKRKVRALEEEYAALEARRAELEELGRQAQQAASDFPQTKGPAGPADSD
jgi:chromosome segregation ATPase